MNTHIQGKVSKKTKPWPHDDTSHASHGPRAFNENSNLEKSRAIMHRGLVLIIGFQQKNQKIEKSLFFRFKLYRSFRLINQVVWIPKLLQTKKSDQQDECNLKAASLWCVGEIKGNLEKSTFQPEMLFHHFDCLKRFGYERAFETDFGRFFLLFDSSDIFS